MTYLHQLDRAEATLGRIAANLERTESLLAAILAAVTKGDAPPRIQLPPAYTEKAPPSFSSLQGMVAADDPRSSIAPPMGRTITEQAPPLQTDPPAYAWMNNPRMTVSGPLMGTLPPARPDGSKAGPDSIYPNPFLTPGVPNPQVTQETVAQTIAVSGWTATIRPPVSTTSAIKAHIMARDNLPGPASLYELDHFISLELGGHPSDLGNLWCQKYTAEIPDGGAHQKDAVETFLKGQIVSGALTLAEAQARITEDWYAVYLSMRRLGMMPMMVAYDPDGSSDPDDNA